MRRLTILFTILLFIALSGCTETKLPDEQKADQKIELFKRSYFIYNQDNNLILQFLDDNSTLLLTDNFVNLNNTMADSEIIINPELHFLFSEDRSKFLFPVYGTQDSNYFADVYLVDLSKENPSPILVDSSILVHDKIGVSDYSMAIRSNKNFDQFVYVKDYSLYLNNLKTSILISEDVSNLIDANHDLSKVAFEKKGRIYLYENETSFQLSTTNFYGIIEYSEDLETFIFYSNDDGYYYVMNRQEYRFPENYYIQGDGGRGSTTIDSHGRIVALSYENSDKLLKEVVSINTNNSEIESLINNGEHLKLTYVNVINKDNSNQKWPIASLYLMPEFNSDLDSEVLVARTIDDQKLSNLSVNMSELYVSRNGFIVGFEEHYRSDKVMAYLLDKELSTISLNGFNHNDYQTSDFVPFVDWLVKGKKIVSIVNTDKEKVLNENRRILQIHSLVDSNSPVEAQVISENVCDYDLGLYDSVWKVDAGTIIYRKDQPEYQGCDYSNPSLIYINDELLDDYSSDGSVSSIVKLQNTSDYIYLTNSKFEGSDMKLHTGDRSPLISENVYYIVSDGGKYVLYFSARNFDNLTPDGEIWLFDGMNSTSLISSAKKLFFVYNANE